MSTETVIQKEVASHEDKSSLQTGTLSQQTQVVQVRREVTSRKREAASCKITELLEKSNTILKPGLETSVQNELAKYIILLPHLEKSGDLGLIGAAEIGISALLMNPPNIELAKGIQKGIRRQIHITKWGMLEAILSKSPVTRVVVGLSLIFYIVVLPLSLVYLPKAFSGIDANFLVLVGLTGALGSIISIATRLKAFVHAKQEDPMLLFFHGFFKPVIGIGFALFVFTFISSGLISVSVASDKVRYFFLALSFLAGFSERFAQDIMTKTEGTLFPTEQHDS